jgi:hypothetical protein
MWELLLLDVFETGATNEDEILKLGCQHMRSLLWQHYKNYVPL